MGGLMTTTCDDLDDLDCLKCHPIDGPPVALEHALTGARIGQLVRVVKCALGMPEHIGAVGRISWRPPSRATTGSNLRFAQHVEVSLAGLDNEVCNAVTVVPIGEHARGRVAEEVIES